MLVAQRDRDHEGHGVSLRPVAEATYQEIYQSTLTSTKLSRTLTQLAVSFDRLLSDERRCDAYRCAIDRAIHSGARTFAVLGVGSLLPALHAARCGAHVAVVESVEPLAQLIRNGAAANGLRLAVVSSCEKLRSAWGGEPPDALLSERIDESLLSEGLLPSLRAAVNAFGGRVPSHGVLPGKAVLTACPVQLGFENVGGFGLDGLDIDLRHFDALRPSGLFAQQAPGYWPVRLLPARQPHARLGEAFVAARLDFAKLSVSSGSSVMNATHEVVMTRDGLLNAVVFWFDLHVYKQQQSSSQQQQEECCVSSAPPDLGSRGGVAGGWSEGWKQAACYLASPRYVKKGEVMKIRVIIEETRVRYELLEEDGDPSMSGFIVSGGGGGNGSLPVRAPISNLPRKLNPSAAIPINAYHFCMVADTVRNVAFRKAIERAVARIVTSSDGGCSVIDIGAGTGLLGLIAKRAGATSLDLIEMNDVLNETARRTLEASGVAVSASSAGSSSVTMAASVGGSNPRRRALPREELQGPVENSDAISGKDAGKGAKKDGGAAEKAKVWHCISTELPIDADRVKGPRGKADLIVSEILDSGLIGEGVLHTMRDATSRLLKPNGTLIPKGARVYVMAVDLRPPEVGDFDLSCLEQLHSGLVYSSVRLHTMGHVKLSSPAEAFHFDFYRPVCLDPSSGRPMDREVRLQLPITRKGNCNAIVWWFDLHLDEETTLTVGPGASVRTWKQNVFHIQGGGTPVKRGDTVEALVWCENDDQIHVVGGLAKEGSKILRPPSSHTTGRIEPTFT